MFIVKACKVFKPLLITNTGGCNKYRINYCVKLDTHNYVIVYADSHRNGRLTRKITPIHYSKLAASNHYEEEKH